MSTTTATVTQSGPARSRFHRLLSALSISSSRGSTYPGPASVDDDGIICIGGLLISTHVSVDRDTQRAYDQEIATRFNQELRQRVPGKIYWLELGVAGFHKARLRPSIIVKTLLTEIKHEIYSHVTRIDWIKPALRRLSLELHVIVSMPLRELADQGKTAANLSKTTYLELPLSATTLCGARIVFPKSRRYRWTLQETSQTEDVTPRPVQSDEPVTEIAEDRLCHHCETRVQRNVQDCPACQHRVCEKCSVVESPMDASAYNCVVGGTWLFGESFYVQTALHPFSDQVFETATQRELSIVPVEDNEPLSLFRPGELEAPSAGSSEVSPMSSNTTGSSSHDSPDGTAVADSDSPRGENLPQSSFRSIEISVSQKGMRCDWLTFSFDEKPLSSAGELLYNNVVQSIPVTDIYLEEPEIILPVSICLPTGTIAGMLLPGKVHYHLPHRDFELRAVSLEFPLAKGCSGAWVTHVNKLCGVVVLGMAAVAMIYIMPAELIREEMEAVSNLSVRLPGKDELDTQHRKLQRADVKLHVEPLEKSFADTEPGGLGLRPWSVNSWLTQTSASRREYTTSTTSEKRPPRVFLRRLLEPFRKSRRSSISSGSESISTSAPSLVSSSPFTNADTFSTRPSSIAASSRPQPNKALQESHRPGLRPISELDGPIPSLVECGLVVFFGDKSHSIDRDLIDWNDRSWFKKYEYAAERLLMEQGHFKSKGKDAILYKKAGRCRLVRCLPQDYEVEVESYVVETERDWESTIPVMVTDFALKNLYAKFYLELRWEYAVLHIRREGGENYAKTIRRALHDNVVTNWEKKKFVPRLILRELFTNATVQELINTDKSVRQLSENGTLDKARLINNVIDRGVHLLALAVYAGVDLSCVYQLMLNPGDCNREIHEAECPRDVDKTKFEIIVDFQGRFKAHIFPSDIDRHGTKSVEHRHLGSHVVVPILWDEKSRSVGSGAFGEVFKIKIHSDHHYFSSVRPQYPGVTYLTLTFISGS